MYAEDLNYWETSRSSPDDWIAKSKKLLTEIKAQIISEAFGSYGGKSAYMLQFKIGDDDFKVIWPVLISRSGKELAARRQAATLLYYDIKAKVMTAKVLGTKSAFFSYILLPDGRSMSILSTPELADYFPLQLTGGH